MSQSVSVSIIVPVYNVGKYVERCIRSIIAQTYTGSMECIIVDDRGSDDSMERVNRLLDNYDGPIDFKIITHPENKGISEARNTGIRNATGDYILFLDSDDEISIHALTYFIQKAAETPDAEIIVGDYYLPKREIRFHPNKDLSTHQKSKIALIAPRGLIPFTHNRLIKRSFIINHNLYFEPFKYLEDNLWTWKAAKYISSIAFTNKPSYIYFSNLDSVMHQFSFDRIKDCVKICDIKASTIDSGCENWQIRNAISHVLNTDSDIRYTSTGKEYIEKLKTLKAIVKKLNHESIKAFDIRSLLSLLLLNIELRLPISVNNRLYWWLHRGAKMFAVYPRPKF